MGSGARQDTGSEKYHLTVLAAAHLFGRERHVMRPQQLRLTACRWRKSTLADRLAMAVGADWVRLDDFVKPEAQWPSRDQPSLPFDYIRYNEFMAAVTQLATSGFCSFRPFNFETFGIEGEAREIRLDRPVIVEGVSALHTDLAAFYDLRIWVESDGASTLAAAGQRGLGPWAREWRDLFLPSVDLSLRTKP